MRLVDDFDMYCAGGSVCYLCGGAKHLDDVGVIDWDREIDMEGRLMTCWSCAEELSSLIGCASESETKRLRGRVRNLEDQCIQLEMELQGVGERVRAAI